MLRLSSTSDGRRLSANRRARVQAHYTLAADYVLYKFWRLCVSIYVNFKCYIATPFFLSLIHTLKKKRVKFKDCFERTAHVYLILV